MLRSVAQGKILQRLVEPHEGATTALCRSLCSYGPLYLIRGARALAAAPVQASFCSRHGGRANRFCPPAAPPQRTNYATGLVRVDRLVDPLGPTLLRGGISLALPVVQAPVGHAASDEVAVARAACRTFPFVRQLRADQPGA